MELTIAIIVYAIIGAGTALNFFLALQTDQENRAQQDTIYRIRLRRKDVHVVSMIVVSLLCGVVWPVLLVSALWTLLLR